MPTGRTYSSPATDAQREYIARLMRTKLVPAWLKHQVGMVDNVLTDGHCRDLIPRLEDCPYLPTPTRLLLDGAGVPVTATFPTTTTLSSATITSGGWCAPPDHDLSDWEDWRDHPDAIAGHPGEHGSH